MFAAEKSRFQHLTLVVAVASALTGHVATPIAAHAFNSYHPMIHSQITGAAAGNTGFPPRTAGELADKVRNPDWDENDVIWWRLTIRPNDSYRADHHFDRGPSVTSRQAFLNGRAYMQGQMYAAILAAQQGNCQAALEALGRALHALQDFFSHSNYAGPSAAVDPAHSGLSPADQAACDAALFDGGVAPPKALEMTSYDPAAADPEHPPWDGGSDGYTHGDHAKDTNSKNGDSAAPNANAPGSSNFAVAKAAAQQASQRLLSLVLAALGDEATRQSLLNCYVEKPGFVQYKWADQTVIFTFGGDYSTHGTRLVIPVGAFIGPDTLGVLAPGDRMFRTLDESRSSDGASMVVIREIQMAPDPGHLDPPIQMTVAFADSEVELVSGQTLSVYQGTSDAAGNADWVPVPGGLVDLAARTARVPVSGPGLYAIGGRAVAVPGSSPRQLVLLAALMMIAGGANLWWRRWPLERTARTDEQMVQHRQSFAILWNPSLKCWAISVTMSGGVSPASGGVA